LTLVLLSRIQKYSKWGRLVAGTGVAQVAVQALGFLAGIITIRLLPQDQYAYYTLGTSMLAIMTVLADGGISTGVISLGGEKWSDKEELGRIIATGLALRRKFACYSALIILPILFYLVYEQSNDFFWPIVICVAIIPAFISALSYSLLNIGPRLHQQIRDIMSISLVISGIKLVLSIVLLFIMPFSYIALVVIGVSQIIGNSRLRNVTIKIANYKTEADAAIRRKILVVVKKVLPGTIYYCLAGQISVFLISIFGQTNDIASIGALSRLMVLLALVKSLIDLLIVPSFAKIVSGSTQVTIRFWQSVALTIAVCIIIVGGVWLLPEYVLWVLGPKYADLQYEALLITIGTCLSLVSGTMNNLTASRGIIPDPIYFISTVVISQIFILVFLVDYSTISGVLMVAIYSAAVTILYRTVHFQFYLGNSRNGNLSSFIDRQDLS